MDIVFLQENIEKYSYDPAVTTALKRILRGLTVAEMHPAFMRNGEDSGNQEGGMHFCHGKTAEDPFQR